MNDMERFRAIYTLLGGLIADSDTNGTVPHRRLQRSEDDSTIRTNGARLNNPMDPRWADAPESYDDRTVAQCAYIIGRLQGRTLSAEETAEQLEVNIQRQARIIEADRATTDGTVEYNAALLDRLDKIRDIHAIQGSDGNWDVSAYMCGMFNGLELALSIMEDRDVTYRDVPLTDAQQALDDESFARGYQRGCGDTKLECEQEKGYITSNHRKIIAEYDAQLDNLVKQRDAANARTQKLETKLENDKYVVDDRTTRLRTEIEDIAGKLVTAAVENKELKEKSAHYVLMDMLRANATLGVFYSYMDEQSRYTEFKPNRIALGNTNDPTLPALVGTNTLTGTECSFVASEVVRWGVAPLKQ